MSYFHPPANPDKPSIETLRYPDALAPLAAFPCRQFLLRQRTKKAIGNHDLALQNVGLPLTVRLAADKPRDWLAPAGDNDILARFNPRQQSGKLGLGLMNINNEHGLVPGLRNPANIVVYMLDEFKNPALIQYV